MDLILKPARLTGAVMPPPSKSQAHRLLIAAALSDGVSEIEGVSDSQDMEATIRCMRALGAEFRRRAGGVSVTGLFCGGAPRCEALPRLDCGESGSTLRFLIPVALAVAGGGVFMGRGRLMERPQTAYAALFREKGIAFSLEDSVLTVRGVLRPGDYRLPGNVSSQFFTGLLYALPLLNGLSRLESTTELESAGYLDMTLEALHGAGITAARTGNAFFVMPGHYRSGRWAVEADWSQAAFFCVANGIGNAIQILGLNPDSAQGDRVIESYVNQMRASGPVTLDVRQCPDLAPALALQAALRAGEITRIVGAARLRIKESDRLATVTAALSALGAQIAEGPESLEIHGVSAFHGGEAHSGNDHRIAMMTAMAATRADGPVILRDAGCVAKSYPDFWQVYGRLGGKFEEIKE
ncbi:MAG: 3-phosphoshikimate 1-carboxyvinyltransferase [Oscillospiraceae bacterium]|nr:3-phosphoshikimate 1-carboxyvinyltransferase [Oscillospiraceae bacterium]